MSQGLSLISAKDYLTRLISYLNKGLSQKACLLSLRKLISQRLIYYLYECVSHKAYLLSLKRFITHDLFLPLWRLISQDWDNICLPEPFLIKANAPTEQYENSPGILSNNVKHCRSVRNVNDGYWFAILILFFILSVSNMNICYNNIVIDIRGHL